MLWFRRLLLLLPGRRHARAQELEAELASNLEMAVEDADSPDAARMARRDFGSLTRAREEVRDVWFPGWDALAQDVRYACRTLARSPGFAAVAVLSLAVGIGSAVALFSLVDAVLLQPLQYRAPERLALVREVVPPLAHTYPTLPVNIQHFRFWREHARNFERIAAFLGSSTTLGAERPEVIDGAAVSANLFQVLGVKPQIGRSFLAEEEQPGHDQEVILTDALWRRRFNASPDVVGRTILLAGSPYAVVGVLPPGFRFPTGSDLGPLAQLGPRVEFFRPLGGTNRGWGGDYDYTVVGRLRPGVSLQSGVAELNALEARIVSDHGLPYSGLHVEARPLQDVMVSPVRTSLTVLLGAVLLLLAIVCVNLANLLLARFSARAHEFGLRIALGAPRGRLAISGVTEALLLSAAGGALGVVAARAAVRAFVASSPVRLPRLDEVAVNGTVLLFAVVLALACGLFFGLLPALRLAGADPQKLLRASGRSASEGRHGLRLREWLVGGEVGLSTLLLVLAGLLFSSLWHVLHVERGFTEDWAVWINVYPTGPAYRGNEPRIGFFERAMTRIRALPGVTSAAVISYPPLTGESNVNSVVLEGGAEALDPATHSLIQVNVRFISGDYFRTLGIPLRSGRAIEEADRNRNVVVVSERLAAEAWPGQNPLGRHILEAGSGVQNAVVVGVVADVHTVRLDADPTLMIYVPFWRIPNTATGIVVRTAGDPRGLMGDLRRAIREAEPAAPIRRMRTMREIVEQTVAQRRFQMRVSAAFGIAALLLAALGVYGVVAYGVTLRRREIGIRLALGASESQVARQVAAEGMRPVAIGLAAGLVASLAAGGAVRGMLFGVVPADPLTLGGVAFTLGLAALLACLLPARSATRLDPAKVLRAE